MEGATGEPFMPGHHEGKAFKMEKAITLLPGFCWASPSLGRKDRMSGLLKKRETHTQGKMAVTTGNGAEMGRQVCPVIILKQSLPLNDIFID